MKIQKNLSISLVIGLIVLLAGGGVYLYLKHAPGSSTRISLAPDAVFSLCSTQKDVLDCIEKQAISVHDTNLCSVIGKIANSSTNQTDQEKTTFKNLLQIGREQCKQVVVFSSNSIDLKECNLLSESYSALCQEEYAEQNLDENQCLSIPSMWVEAIGNCLTNIAIKKGDQKICSLIKDKQRLDTCNKDISDVTAKSKLTVQQCLALPNGKGTTSAPSQSTCLRIVAKNTNNIETCNLISDAYKFDKVFCKIDIQPEVNSCMITINNTDDKFTQMECLETVAKKIKDFSICNEIKSPLDNLSEPYTNLPDSQFINHCKAMVTANPSFCMNQPNASDITDCFRDVRNKSLQSY